MRTTLFENPKHALIFGGAILLAAVVLIGEEDDEGALVAATYSDAAAAPSFASGSDAGIRDYSPAGSEDDGASSSGWDDEGDLVDDAEGVDASPSDSTSVSGSTDTDTYRPDPRRPPGIDGPGT